ncbi:hypothetical protein ACN27E_06200 [Mycobacterium sp. WMMD1722]|uniref:hypothetical protein n=1 Tax=Mycobacterium sp. WMMD1722 TaxID=3404117 RepID=UPI003BF612F9
MPDDVVAQLRMSLVDRQSLPGEPVLIPAPLDPVLTLELDGAAFALGLTGDELLLAAFGRAVARVIGEGVVAVDVLRGSAPAGIDLCCAGERQMDATELVRLVRQALLSSTGFGADVSAEALFNYSGTTPACADEGPLAGYALEVRAYRDQNLMWLDWWFDSARFDAATVRELSEQFPFALIELTSEALPVE